MFKRILTISIIIIMLDMTSMATIINIPDDYPTIQQGIDASTDGDTVLVQPGTYIENINFNGHNIVLGSLFLTAGDTTYIEQTIIDGDSAGTVVVFENQESDRCFIIGFTIRHGFNTINENRGGGIVIQGSNPNIRFNIIKENRTAEYGGGIYIDNADAEIQYNKIRDNLASTGGGIYCRDSQAIISYNTIESNFAADGGGIGCAGSTAYIYRNVIRENTACNIVINGGGCGGGIHCNSNPYILNNIILNNHAVGGWDGTGEGGGISMSISQSLPVFCNNVIVNNTATSGNPMPGAGPGIHLGGNGPNFYITNSIVRGNTSDFPDDYQISGFDLNTSCQFCNIEGGFSGEGNIDQDPLFRDPENGDFHLMAIDCGDPYDSPCIDMGKPSILDTLLDCAWGLGTSRSDMGAYGGGDGMVSIDDPAKTLPRQFTLSQNYPNPFNASTMIEYELPIQTQVTLDIYDILGKKITTLDNGLQLAGYHRVIWDASDVSSGIYFYKLQADHYNKSKKMILIK